MNHTNISYLTALFFSLFLLLTPLAALATGDGLKADYWNFSVKNNGYSFPTSAPTLTRIDSTIDFNWGSGSPAATINRNGFATRWEGVVEITETGIYSFHTQSDDGIRLWVNEQLVINNWTLHGPTWNTSSTISLVAGTQYQIKMEFFEHTGGAVARLHWKTPSNINRHVIPKSHLYSTVTPQVVAVSAPDSCNTNNEVLVRYNTAMKTGSIADGAERIGSYSISPLTPPGLSITAATLVSGEPNVVKLTFNDTLDLNTTYALTIENVKSTSGLDLSPNPNTFNFKLDSIGSGLKANYWNYNVVANSYDFPTSSPDLSLIDSVVNNNWGSSSPKPSITADNFAVRWQGSILAPDSGNYIFSTVSDDGVRLWVDDQLVIDNWTRHSPKLNNSTNISLTAGERYNIRMEYFENTGGAVAQLLWTKPSGGGRVVIPSTALFPCPVSVSIPAPIAEYHFDESNWNGISNEVRDDSGNELHGVAKSGADTRQLSPAIIGNPGTCGYGVFDGQNDYVEIADSPQFDIRDELTVSTWIYPLFIPRSGLKSIVSKDTNYEFHLNSSGQIFWWWGGGSRSLTTTGARIPINTWTHISIVYSDRNNSQAIYINGVLRASKSISGALSLNNKPFQIGADQNVSGRFFLGRIDETMVYNQALTQSEVQQVMTATHPCDVITEASNFNCVATNSDAITGRLYTQISNHPFTIDVAALQNTTTLATNFSNTVSVELVNASSGDCSTHPVLNPEINQSLNFVSGSGIEASAEMTSSNAYQNLKCRVTDTTSGSTIVGCSTDAFAIRPESFTITSPVNNNSHSGSPTKIAGTEFNITANTNISNYDGTPIIDASQITAHAGAIQTGVLAGSFPAADPATGNSTGSNFTYSEVGNIQLNANAIIDSSYTAIDTAGGDCTNNSSNIANADGKISCNIVNDSAIDIGRFIPDHFEISIVNQGSFGGSAYACTNFNYIGQDFSYDTEPEIKVTAYNGLTPKAITQNYTNNYAKLALGNFNFTPPTSDANKLGTDGLNLVNLNWSAVAPDLADNHNGSLTLTFGDDNFNYLQQTNSLVAPFTNSVEFEFTDITDSDSVSSSNLPLSATPSGALMRFGRLSIHSSHGAETVPLTVPVITEYFNGTNWAVNNMDSCTSPNITSNILLSNPASGNNLPGNSLMIIENGSSSSSFVNAPFSAGIGNLIFTAPGEDNQGYIDIKGSLTGFEWLQFDWNSDGSFTNNPSGRASFGLFKGSEKLIFRREVY